MKQKSERNTLQSIKFESFSKKIYQKQSNNYMVRFLWAVVFMQFPVTFTLSYYHFIYVRPHVFFYNAILTAIITLTLAYIDKKYVFTEKIKYFIIIFLLILDGEFVYVYLNDLAIQFFWIFPVILAGFYLDNSISIFTIVASLMGLAVYDFLVPITFMPSRFLDLYTTSVMIILGIITAIYFQNRYTRQIKYSVDDAVKSISHGTSIINHAVKNELNNILVCVDNIKRELQRKNIILESADFEIIDETVDHLNEFIARIQKEISGVTLHKTSTDISRLLDNCLDSLTPLAKSRNILINRVYQPSIIISCDPISIREVFNNIVRNSIEAIDLNKQGEITVLVKNAGKNTTIDFSDNGCGISKEHLPRVVDPFFSTKKYRSNNFGLGLTYCYNIIKEHDAEFDIFSEVNTGTTVSILFKG